METKLKTWTTLSELKNAGSCEARYRHLCKALGGAESYGKDTPISLMKILETNGINDCEWAIGMVASLSPLDDDYWAKRKPLDDDYWAKRKTLDDDYWAKRKTLFIGILEANT